MSRDGSGSTPNRRSACVGSHQSAMERKIAGLAAKRPKRLYKYQSISGPWSVTNLEKRQIYFQVPTHLNDPFDCRNYLEFTMNKEEIEPTIEIVKRESGNVVTAQEYNSPKFSAAYQHAVLVASEKYANSVVEDTATKGGIACFSQCKSDLLMWAHYAEGHRGYCLEFDTSFEPFNKAFPVSYVAKKRRISILQILRNSGLFLIPLLFSKARCWKYEKEWRIFNNRGPGTVRFAHGCLTAVYLGVNMTEDNKHMIRQCINAPSYFEAQRSPSEFALEFRKIT